MSKWIEEKWLNKRIKDSYRERIGLDSAPSIDIVPCGECKHWDDRRKDDWWSEEGACYLTSRLGDATYRNHDDFCSYGEREGE